ncbi:aminotransferase, class III [Trichuris suis]|nr:aminotransferase, class III [Trichuris suis]
MEAGIDSDVALMTKELVVAERKEWIGSAVTVFYRDNPLMIVRAERQYLYDESGKRYLDCISNVQHVGHSHPLVGQAVAKQILLSTCNNRFLHPLMTIYAQRLAKSLPSDLNTFFYCNSGALSPSEGRSEANDLALRIAKDYTGGTEVIVVEHAYHGHLTSMIDISPYKFNGKGGSGKPDHAPCPDVYRGKWRLPTEKLDDKESLTKMGAKYALEVKMLCDQIASKGRRLAAFFMEALISCGGQVFPPEGYLRDVIDYVHEAGGLVIVDEVQTGFGRAGSVFWAYQSHCPDSAPDMITMGKPMGNGYPVAAVVTRRPVADEFGHGMEYFNTYGGNPVSCAAALAVLNVLEEEQLQENARNVGAYLLERLRWLQGRHSSVVGHVRALGLFAGIDLVTNLESRLPATQLAAKVVSEMRKKQVCISSEGPHGNILKFKPPICFTKTNVDEMIKALDETLVEVTSSPRNLS